MSNKDFSIGKSRSPYKIQVAPGFNADNSAERMQAYLAIRGEQEAMNTQKKQLIGNLDSLSSDFQSIFTIFSNIRSKLNETERLPFISKMHLNVLRTLIKIVDKLNSVIANKIIPMIDELGK